MRAAPKRRRWRVITAAAAAIWLLSSCLGPTAGEVPIATLDAPVEKKLAFAAGKELSFPVHAESYDYSGANHVLIEVTLLRAGAPVGKMTCAGFELEGGAGCGSGATHLNSDCSITVPAGGSDSIRVLATLQDKSSRASFKGLSVYIRD